MILGNLNPTRDFNYVEDTCATYFSVLKNKKLIGKTINIGSNTNISIENLAKKNYENNWKKSKISKK